MKIPYSLVAAVDVETRHAQMLEAVRHGFPRLEQVPIDERKTLHVACYGPSLEDTWRNLGRPIISMSGATKFLAERGVVPDYHCDMDPRPHKLSFIDPPVPGVHYLMASVCHPRAWEILKAAGAPVTLWHCISSYEHTLPFMDKMLPGELVVFGGSTIGLTALHLGGLMGYRHFEVHGMDGSFRPGTKDRHAGFHTGKVQKDVITWDAGGVTYRTSKIMANAVAETINQVTNQPMLCVFHGEGLTQALIREANLDNACCADEAEKAARIRRSGVETVTLGADKIDRNLTAFEALVQAPPREWVFDMELAASKAETLRGKAKFDTGTISLRAMLYLRAIVEVVRPKTIIEVGTFIGSSTAAMERGLLAHGGGRIFTCDSRNDCLPSTDVIECHPWQTSTQMLTALVAKGVKADLFFFDGRIQLPDLPLILKCSTPKTVYAFDDHMGQEKGVVNVNLLAPLLPRHGFLPPPDRLPGPVTIAVLGPRA